MFYFKVNVIDRFCQYVYMQHKKGCEIELYM